MNEYNTIVEYILMIENLIIQISNSMAKYVKNW